MAQLIIEIPDAIAPRVLKTLCSRFGYVGTVKDLDGVTDIPNPETREHFVRRKVAGLLKDICVATEAQKAEHAARIAAHAAARAEIDLTQS
jgi:hypothetical protein